MSEVDEYSMRLKAPIFFSMMLFVLAWLLPNHYFPWVMAYQEFLSFFSGFLLVFFVFLAKFSRFPRSCIFFCFLPFIPLLQALTGLVFFSGDAWVAALYLGAFALMIFVGFNFAVDINIRSYFICLMASVFIVGAIFSVWIALRQWLMLSGSIWVADMPPGGRPFANLAQPNNLATLLCMGLAGVIYLYEKYYIGRLVSGILVFFLLFGITLTQSRTPLVGAFAVVVFLIWKSFSCQLRLSLMSVFFWLVVYFVFIFVFPLLSDFLLLPSSGVLERSQSLERLDMWLQFWHAVWLKPVLGYGWNQVSVAQVATSLVYPVPILTEHSHNIMLDMLLWNGVVLGGVIISFVVVWLGRLVWSAHSSESLFVLLAVCFVLVHAMFEFPLEYAFFLLPVGLLLGVAVAESPTAHAFFLPRWVLGGVLAFLGGVFCWVWFEYRIIEEDHRLMRFENAQIGDLKAVQEAPDVVLLTQLREFIRFARTPATINMSREQIEWMRKVSHRYPYVSSIFRYSLALALNGQADAAREQLLILRALHGEKYYAEGMQSLWDMSASYPQLVTVLHGLPVVEP